MLRHYAELKARHPDALLFYRLGDFYELFYEDAIRAAPVLEVTLTARHRGTEQEAPMCGVPHHALESYLAKAVRAGLKVAICDQVEDAAQAKGLVKREVTRLITPGTLTDPALLEGRAESLLAAIAWRADGGAGAFLDVSTGALFVRRWATLDAAADDLRVVAPAELVYDESLPPAALAALDGVGPASRTALGGGRFPDGRRAADLLRRQFGVASLRGFGIEEGEPAASAAAAALAYAEETQLRPLAHVRALELREEDDALGLDATTLANLEVLRPLRDEGRGPSLLAVLDHTATSGGARRLREWLRRPLRAPEAIRARLRAVAALVDGAPVRERVRAGLRRVPDLERLVARAALGSLQPREAAALRDGLDAAPQLLADLGHLDARVLAEIAATDPLADLAARLRATLLEAPAARVDDGAVIADGVDAALDEARSLAHDSRRHVLALEARERERTGIASLKIRYHRVFGYTIEITRAHADRALPADYKRRQTLANAERYVTAEVAELEEKILGAEARQTALEGALFAALREAVAAEAPRLLRLGTALAALDALAALAEAAERFGYRAPTIGEPGGALRIRDGRHPIVERYATDGRDPFVPNDLDLDPVGDGGARVVVLTGPNMGGKSTYLRQVALIVLMAQAGSFVPAAEAEIGVVDRIFTRVGASDDLARGESTFMIEMIETARILRQATDRSLVVLDEVGRGTATFDGLALAWAIVEHLHETVGAKTLFATHYHELTELASYLPRVVNRTMAVKEWNDGVVFLRRVVPGRADRSYGLHVARLAGVPEAVVRRAGAVLAGLERQEVDAAGIPKAAVGAEATPAALTAAPAQLGLFRAADEMVLEILRRADLEQLTPVAALNLLRTLRGRLEGR
jgi:DNA mismatch repair protein MutS